MDFYLSIEAGHVVVTGLNPKDTGTIIFTIDHYNEYFDRKAELAGVDVEDLAIMSSSALDFPAEFTDSATVIALCAAIRGYVADDTFPGVVSDQEVTQ